MKLRKANKEELAGCPEVLATLETGDRGYVVIFKKEKLLECRALIDKFISENKEMFACAACNGSGIYDDGKGKPCGSCGGSGIDLEP